MAVSANHAGGYSWRLCKDDGNVSEACFQQNTLRFAGSKQWIYFANQEWSEIPLVKVSQGTFPEGSEWARFPVPSCVQCNPATECGTPLPAMPGGDPKSDWNQQVNCNAACHGSTVSKTTGTCPGSSQFPEPIPGMSGFGKSIWEWSVVDQVVVPHNLEPGDYLLSWRWDCEQSDQVFQNCADIRITHDPSGGAQRIRMDPNKRVNVYKGSGNVECDGLYESCEQANLSKQDDGAACQKLGVSGCPANAKCEVATKGGKEYCGQKLLKGQTPNMPCAGYGVQGCSQHSECTILSSQGKTYCWTRDAEAVAKGSNGTTTKPEPGPEPEPESATNETEPAANGNQSSLGTSTSTSNYVMTGVLSMLLYVMCASPL